MTTPVSGTPVTVSSLLGDISQYVTNPAPIQQRILAALTQITDGQIDVVDATNPFAFCLEASACNMAAFVQEAAALTRRQYPAAATTFEDLYLHMADRDYLNMFALPSKATFTVMLNYQQLLAHLVEDAAGISQITIPRNTIFYAAETPFSLQYPINIRQLQHGGLQVVYDATVPSPLQTLSTNVVPMRMSQAPNGQTYLLFDVEALQFKIVSFVNDVNSTSGMVSRVPFTDQFYYCRVYTQNTDSTWREIATTFTEQVYDPGTPTAVLQVTDSQVIVKIPPVYTINQLVRGKIRIDVYQTKGPQVIYMGNLGPKDFSADWQFIDKNDAMPETAAITKINDVQVWSTSVTSGGRNALTFQQMQQRVIANAIGPRQIPISPAQIQAYVTDDGYTVVKNLDTLTNRAFWATKPLPAPTELNPTVTNNVFTAANASMLKVLMSVSDAATSYGCTTHATGATVTSAALFHTANGITSLVSASAFATLTSLPLLEQAETLNSGEYFFTPFYYVLDDSTDVFDVRPYFLDQPEISSRVFVQENATTGLQVSIADGAFSFTKTSTGYQLTLTTASNDVYRALSDSQVQCQLSFKTSDGLATAYMLGAQQTRAKDTDERVFIFNITTTYDIDRDHAIDLPTFGLDASSIVPKGVLSQLFSVYFTTSAPMPGTYVSSNIDAGLGAWQLAPDSVGITYEQLTLTLGDYLPTLWNEYRSFSDVIPFQTYATDVVAHYDKDVYATDPVTGSGFSVVDGDLTYTILHHAGDVILDSDGHTTYTHRVGDLILSPETGLPQAVLGYQTTLQRLVSVFVLDAVYRFANDPITVDYVGYVKQFLLTALTEDLKDLNENVLEQTTIYFHPTVNQGTITVFIEDNAITTMTAEQSLEVTMYVPTETHNNANLLSSLFGSTVKTIGEYFATHNTVAQDELQDNLRKVYGVDVAAVTVKGLGGHDKDYPVITIEDDSTRLSIKKVLTVQTNNQMSVQEDVKITVVVHDV